MSWTPEFEPRKGESVPYELLYDTAFSRLVEAVKRSGENQVKFWQLHKSPMIGVEDMPQYYAGLQLVDDFNDLVTSGYSSRLDVWIPLTGPDIDAPQPIMSGHSSSHILVLGTEPGQDDESVVKIAPHGISAISGTKNGIQSLAFKDTTDKPIIEYATNVEYETNGGRDSDNIHYDWVMGVTTRICFYDLVPTINKSTDPDLTL